jgi:malate dehydrogenase (oxaloacetate-decarboxylating)
MPETPTLPEMNEVSSTPSQPPSVHDAVAIRRYYNGLLKIQIKTPVRDKEMLAVVYTPGVAKPCLEIQRDEQLSFPFTMRGNTIGIVSNGSSVYGLGEAGAAASIPILESKALLHKHLANVDAVPMAIDTTSEEQFVETIRQLEPTFGAFQLEGIKAPDCYVIEDKLKRALNVPVMHGEHSTAVVLAAGLINALKVAGKKLKETKVVMLGSGTSGIATARLLIQLGVGELRMCDTKGRISNKRPVGMSWMKAQLARHTNPLNLVQSLDECFEGADAYIGFKDAASIDPTLIPKMAEKPIVFAFSLPQAEVSYDEAKKQGAFIYASQQVEYPNTLNVAMAYPGILRGALDVCATRLTRRMFVAATFALAGMLDDADLNPQHLLPDMTPRVAATVARAVAQSAIESGVAREMVSPQSIEKNVLRYMEEGSAAWVKPPLLDRRYEDMSTDEKAMELRRRYQGVIETATALEGSDFDEPTLRELHALPNAVKACREIMEHPEELYNLTCKKNLVAVITDGSAVLGLGNIGAGAGLPVMEGKSVLFKAFGAVEAFPICLNTQSVDELLASIKALTPIFGGINLEDIAAPRCFELEERLIAETDIPIFHDDQHGTAVVVVAAILNAVKAVGKPIETVRIAVNGAGASALSVSNLLLKAGVKDIIICDTKGIIYEGRSFGMNLFKEKIAKLTNLTGQQGSLEDAVRGSDIFIGLSVPGALTQDMVRSMAVDPIVLAMANPTPEIMPDEAKAAGVKIMATGRSDFPNQVNNCLAFPGIFRGALDVRASVINDEMKLASAYAIASVVSEEELKQGIIIPSIFDLSVPPMVAREVAKAAIETGVARVHTLTPDQIAKNLENFLKAQG